MTRPQRAALTRLNNGPLRIGDNGPGFVNYDTFRALERRGLAFLVGGCAHITPAGENVAAGRTLGNGRAAA